MSLEDILEPGEPQRLATGFRFTEGPTWHPDGYFIFVDVIGATPRVYKLVPGSDPEVLRAETGQTDGTDLDMQGNLVMCESLTRQVTRMRGDGSIEVIADRYQDKRFNRPNDIICRSDGSIYFTDPGINAPFAQRELPHNGIFRVTPDGVLSLFADAEHPNGLVFNADESVLYVANTRWSQYIMKFQLNPDGSLIRRGIFADMSSDEAVGPDGLAMDIEGRIYATGAGGTWVFAPDGTKLGVIETPELPANLIFGGEDMRTLFLTARSSVYTVRVKTPGLPHAYHASLQRQ